ncbi:DUF6114 domain-containing protein [Streptomyces longispororuber]|uniref:DUF6114 domain-containing protein n=1 Tax=Streptomyces longispororuber TaxID=68230 RepID=UPI0033CDFA00
MRVTSPPAAGRTLRGRPLAAAALLAAAGAELAYLPLGRPTLLALQGPGATSSLMIAGGLLCVSVVLLYRPRRARVCGVAGMLLGLLSCPLANFGGFLVGMLLAVLGGALAFAWRHPAPAGGAP